MIRRIPPSPHLLAAFTLVAGGALSLAAFRWLEPVAGRLLARRGAAEDDAAGTRSVLFTVASFTAFVSFYSFAGAPTLRLVPEPPTASTPRTAST